MERQCEDCLVVFAVSTINKYRNYGYSSRQGARSQKTCIFINTVRPSNRETWFLLSEVRKKIYAVCFDEILAVNGYVEGVLVFGWSIHDTWLDVWFQWSMVDGCSGKASCLRFDGFICFRFNLVCMRCTSASC